MSDYESDEQENESNSEMAMIVVLLADHPILLTKSQSPEVKAKKGKALEVLVKALVVNCGIHYDPKKVLKKIANMKARVKKSRISREQGTAKSICFHGKLIFSN